MLTDVPLPTILGPLARFLERQLEHSKSALGQRLLEWLRPVLRHWEPELAERQRTVRRVATPVGVGNRDADEDEEEEEAPRRKPIFRRSTPEPDDAPDVADPPSNPTVRVPNFLRRTEEHYPQPQ